MDLHEFYNGVTRNVKCYYMSTIVCSKYTVSNFELLFKDSLLMKSIGDSSSLISMLSDRQSLLALIAKKICLASKEVNAVADNYDLLEVKLKQTTFPLIVSLTYRHLH